ncbi:hypothetical protein GGI42DRAFT_310792 [Trichoderma sp. SZMC 28013]
MSSSISPPIRSASKANRPYSEARRKLLRESKSFLNWENRARIHRATISSLKNASLSLADCKPCRYRLVDCLQLAHHDKFIVYECSDIYGIPYSAISYVWKSNYPSPSQQRGTFVVEGALDGDPISIDILVHAARASIMAGAKYMWMDRLCIIQTSRMDKHWQIKNMYHVYNLCVTCIILPDGVGHLADLDKETSWIKRSWTLQEAVSPKKEPVVLFAWKHGSGRLIDEVDYDDPFMETDQTWWLDVTEITSRRCATCPIRPLLHLTAFQYRSQLFFCPSDRSHDRLLVPKPVVLGSSECRLVPLRDALNPSQREDSRASAIWRSAFTRASSRPVDMVFSIMGLFGITLDVAAFDKDDRVGATIALAQAILENGGKPTWLLISHTLPPCNFLCSFPAFPVSKETGEVTVRAQAGNEVAIEDIMDSGACYDCRDLIEAESLDEKGYLTIKCPAIPIVDMPSDQSIHRDSILETTDGRIWKLQSKPTEVGRHKAGNTYAIAIGKDDVWGDTSQLMGFIVEKHAPDRFHRTASFRLTLDEEMEEKMMSWKQGSFRIGGPDPLPKSHDNDRK